MEIVTERVQGKVKSRNYPTRLGMYWVNKYQSDDTISDILEVPHEDLMDLIVNYDDDSTRQYYLQNKIDGTSLGLVDCHLLVKDPRLLKYIDSRYIYSKSQGLYRTLVDVMTTHYKGESIPYNILKNYIGDCLSTKYIYYSYDSNAQDLIQYVYNMFDELLGYLTISCQHPSYYNEEVLLPLSIGSLQHEIRNNKNPAFISEDIFIKRLMDGVIPDIHAKLRQEQLKGYTHYTELVNYYNTVVDLTRLWATKNKNKYNIYTLELKIEQFKFRRSN